MAGKDRAQTGTLEEALQETPYRFDFFQAVRLLENQRPDRPRVGKSQHSHEDPARFGQEPTLAFPASTLNPFRSLRQASPARMVVNFMGLFGPHGPLPMHLTEYARERLLHDKDASFSRFLDIFHHRMISLFYRAWAANQQAVSYDRPEEDRYGNYVGSFVGVGTESYVNVTQYQIRLNCIMLVGFRVRPATLTGWRRS